MNKVFEFYNPNPKQRFHKDGKPYNWTECDCVVRAFSKVLDLSWKKAYEMMCKIGMDNYTMPNSDKAIDVAAKAADFRRVTYKAGERKPLKEWVKDHKKGTFLVRVSGHITTVIDGKVYDAWDCTDYCVTSYYERY